MMKNCRSLWMLLAWYALTSYYCDAAIWRVNNNGFGANFKELDEVNNADYVMPGDTIHLEGSEKNYGSAEYITKRLVIIGTGYNISENPNTSASGLTSRIGNIYFTEAAAGSQLIGVHVDAGGIAVYVSNVQIKRCRIDNNIFLNYGLADITITQNFFPLAGNHSSVIAPASDFPTNVVFNNNIVQRPLVLYKDQSLAECNNNVFDVLIDTQGNPALSFNTGSFSNNIITKDLKMNVNSGNTTNITNNIVGKFSAFASVNDNIVVEDFTKLFVRAVGSSSDGRYQLLANSPGSAKASDGDDIGAFGSKSVGNRYLLSGLPPVPVIYSLSTTGNASQSGLPVTVKARILN